MIDRDTWLTLAERCAVIRWWHEDDPPPTERIRLEFDSHDQARIIRTGLDGREVVGDTPTVLPP